MQVLDLEKNAVKQYFKQQFSVRKEIQQYTPGEKL